MTDRFEVVVNRLFIDKQVKAEFGKIGEDEQGKPVFDYLPDRIRDVAASEVVFKQIFSVDEFDLSGMATMLNSNRIVSNNFKNALEATDRALGYQGPDWQNVPKRVAELVAIIKAYRDEINELRKSAI